MKPTHLNRRAFLQTTATASVAAAVLSPSRTAFAAGGDTIGIALIGCGDRGTGAAMESLESSPGLELLAMADMFPDRVESALAKIKEKFAANMKVTPATTFLGFDAYQKVLAMPEVKVVLLCTPPAFRPRMVRAALEAGKHIFLEKPGAVDPVGCRSLMQSAELADQKKLSVVVGTQQRWQPQYQEVIKRIRDGDIGKVMGGSAYWNWGFTDWHYQKRKPEWSDLEWQIRCWPYFVWLSGDHIVEQHLHNMDILNWAIGSHPAKVTGFGGRQARVTPDYGNIYDHFVMEYEYPGGERVLSMASQIKNSDAKVGERVVGCKGSTWTTRQGAYIEGEKPWKYEGTPPSGLVAEHAALISSIRDGKPLNECRRIAESTMTLIMGRMAAYSGRVVTWDFAMNKSELDLFPKEALILGPMPVEPVAIPGQWELI